MNISVIYNVSKETMKEFILSNRVVRDDNYSAILEGLKSASILSRMIDLSRVTYNNVFEDTEGMLNHSLADGEVQLIIKYQVDDEEVDNILENSNNRNDEIGRLLTVAQNSTTKVFSTASKSRLYEIFSSLPAVPEESPQITNNNVAAEMDAMPAEPHDASPVQSTVQVRAENPAPENVANPRRTRRPANNFVPSITVGEYLDRFNGINRNARIYISYYEEGDFMEAGIPQFKTLERDLTNVDNETQKFPRGSIVIY